MEKKIITDKQRMLLTLVMVSMLASALWALSGIHTTASDRETGVWEPVKVNPWMEIMLINHTMRTNLPYSVSGKITLREWEDGPVQEEKKFHFEAYDSCCSLYSVDSAKTMLRGKYFNTTCFDLEQYAMIDQHKGAALFQEWLDTSLLQKQFGAGAKNIKVFADNKGSRRISSDLVTGNGVSGIMIQYRIPSYTPSLVKVSLTGTSIPSAKDSMFRVPVLETTYLTTEPLHDVEYKLSVLHNRKIDTQSLLKLAGAAGYRLVRPNYEGRNNEE